MLRTITIGTCVSIQGTFLAQQDDGRITVQVGQDTYVGRPVPQTRPN